MKRKFKALPFFLALIMVFSCIAPLNIEAKEKNTGSVINVTDYGAQADSGQDSAEAIIHAIAAAKKVLDKEESAIINFPKGRYDIYPDKIEARELYISNTVGSNPNYKMKKIGILLEDMDNVTIEGNGSLFMFHGKMTTFASINSENVTFQNFTVDFQTPTVIDATIEKTSGNTATVYIPECYNYEIVDGGRGVKWISDVSPYTNKPYWETKNNMDYTQLFDAKTGLTWRDSNALFSNIKSIKDVGNNRLEFTYNGALDEKIRPGICFQMRHTVRDHAGTFFWKSKNVALKNLDIAFLHGFGMVGQHSDTITLDDVDFEAPLESGRTTAGYADFIQMSGCKGKIDISNCTFSNPHDDPINIHGTFNQVVEVMGPRKFKVKYMHHETSGFPNFFEGDEIEFTKMDTLLPVPNSTAKVVSVDGPDGMGGVGTPGNLQEIIVTLDRDISGIIANQYVIENVTYTPEVHIHNNIFKETPTRGILCTTRKKVLIEDNLFDGMGMASIFISNDAQDWRESGRTEDVTIKNNTFRRGKSDAIYVNPTNPGFAEGIHKNMTIEGNTFFMEDHHVLNAKSVDGLTFKNNKIYLQDPNIQFSLEGNTSPMIAGGTRKIKVDATTTQLNKKVCRFSGCFNVRVEGNSYDTGINAGCQIENGTTLDKIAIIDDIMAIGIDYHAPKGKIFYESNNEKVATISKNGVIAALDEGKATITPYFVAAGRKFPGPAYNLDVVGPIMSEFPKEIYITNKEEKCGKEGVQYKTNLPNSKVKWSVVNASDESSTHCATIDKNGKLTALESGIVQVIAKTANDLEDRKLLSIQIEEKILSNKLYIENVNSIGWKITEDGNIELKSLHGGLWATQKIKNLFNYSVDDKDNVTAVIKMSGRTKNAYDEAGLIFYKDGDNYVSVERKHNNGNPTLNVVNEIAQNANEDGKIPDVSNNDIWFKLEKKGKLITGSYSTNGTTFTEIKTVENNTLGSSFKIGFLAGTGSQKSDAKFIFSELKINDEIVALTNNSTDILPEVESIKTKYIENKNKLVATVKLKDNATYLTKWAVSDSKDGIYSILENVSGDTLITTSDMKNKYVKAAVTPITYITSIYGCTVWSEPIKITGDGVPGFKILKSSNALLKTAQIDNLETEFEKFTPTTLNYYTTAGINERTISTNFEAADAKASVEVFFNGKKVDKNDVLNLHNARNLIEVIVKAEDGITSNHYRFTISRTGENIKELSSLLINNNEIPLTKDVFNYTYPMSKKGKIAVKANPISNKSKIVITINGKVAKDGNGDTKAGLNKVNVLVYSETSAAPISYAINVKVPDNSNANLENLEFGNNVQLDQAFNKDIKEYTGIVTENNTAIKAVAEETDAIIEIFTGDKEIDKGFGSVYTACTLNEGKNEITIKVTSPNKETSKTYKVKLRGEGTVYLSDMKWESETSGDAPANPTRKDKSTGNNPINLWNGKEFQTFKKGIGSHARSSIVYNIEGKGFETFKTFAGIDKEITKANEPSIIFKVYVDDKEVASSPEMTYKSKMHEFNIDVKNAKKIELIMEPGTHIWSDHGDWADAKFTKPFETSKSFTVTTTVNDEAMGTTTMDKVDGVYSKNTIATLTAKANDGFTFVNWTDANGNVVSTEKVYKPVVTSDVTYTANFQKVNKPLVFKVTATVNDKTMGTVSLDKEDGLYTKDAIATLTAKANDGFTFVNWTDANGNVVSTEKVYKPVVTSDVTYTANFQKVNKPLIFKVTATVNDKTMGTVSLDKEDGLYAKDAIATLTAKANDGFTFVNWTDIKGNVLNDKEVYQYVVKGDVAIVANFKKIAEEKPSNKPESNTSTNNNKVDQPDKNIDKADSVKTNDNSTINIWIGLLVIVSGIVIFVKRKEYNK